jgi:hypothetical protein
MQQKIKLQPRNQESKNQGAHTYTMGPRIKQPPQQATIRPKITQPPPSPPSPHNQESTIHHATKNQHSYYTTKNQAANMRPRLATTQEPRIIKKSSSHHENKLPRINQPPLNQESNSHHVTKNQAATIVLILRIISIHQETMQPIKQPPHHTQESKNQAFTTRPHKTM